MCRTVEDMHISDAPSRQELDGAGCGSRSSCQKQVFLSQDAMLSLVVLNSGCMVLLKTYKLQIILLIKFNNSLVAPYTPELRLDLLKI